MLQKGLTKYLFLSLSWSCLDVYIKSNPNLLTNLNSAQVESKDIVLHRLVPLLNQRKVRFKFATYGLASAVASARPSLSNEAHSEYEVELFHVNDPPILV